jgi:hypothetical protein
VPDVSGPVIMGAEGWAPAASGATVVTTAPAIPATRANEARRDVRVRRRDTKGIEALSSNSTGTVIKVGAPGRQVARTLVHPHVRCKDGQIFYRGGRRAHHWQ